MTSRIVYLAGLGLVAWCAFSQPVAAGEFVRLDFVVSDVETLDPTAPEQQPQILRPRKTVCCRP